MQGGATAGTGSEQPFHRSECRTGIQRLTTPGAGGASHRRPPGTRGSAPTIDLERVYRGPAARICDDGLPLSLPEPAAAILASRGATRKSGLAVVRERVTAIGIRRAGARAAGPCGRLVWPG